ncbi:MAG: type 1 glutamine amidotransferase [Nitrospirota bacterium]
MAVLIVKNIQTEGPGLIEEFLRREDIDFSIVELGSGEIAPSLDEYGAIVVLGGPMGVYEMDDYPHLLAESRLIREAINRDLKVLGICLGCQMIAYCLGAEVYAGHAKEAGWGHIELSGEGLKDSVMRQLAIHPRVGDFWRRFKVFHWHHDTFNLPAGAVLLASSDLYKNQAFRYGSRVYGFQFHIEVTKDMVLDWFKEESGIESILKETENIYEEYSGRASKFLKAFFKDISHR